jgi:hypothetical protein
MINTTNNYKTAIKAAKRHLKAKVELYSGSSLVNTYTQNDALKSVTIDRVGEESKFFGFGVSHKFNIKLIDVARAINLTTDNYFKIYLGVEDEYITYPKAHITEVNRDENTNELSITAYDVLKDTKTATVNDLGLEAPYTIQDVVKASGELLGCNKYIKESKNLLKGLSTPINNSDYWYVVDEHYFTPLENGWGKFEYDNTNGTATVFINAKVKLSAVTLKENTTYTFLTEIRNSNISENSGAFFQIVTNNPTIAFSEASSLGYSNINTGGVFKKVLKTKESFNGVDVAIDSYLRLSKGTKGTVEARISIVEGDYTNEDLTFEPYYKTEVIYTGKNLFNKDLYTYDYVTQNNTGNVGNYKNIPIYVGKPNTTYFISTNFLNGYTPYGKDYLWVLVSNSATTNNAWVGIGHTGIKPTDTSYYNNTLVSDDKGYLYLRVYKNLSKAVYEELMANIETQIEEGTKTDYEPYNTAFEIEYTDGANFEGTETLEEALRAAAEATQTIYYVNSNDNLIFKRLGGIAASITKDEYFTLDSKTNKRLQTICSATELGDNVSAATSLVGSTQYLRDNPFLELREDIATILDNAIAAVGNMTINQFSCEWRGDPSLEPGDKLELTTKDNNKVISYLLNDSLTYEGGLKQKTQWNYTDSEEAESTPTKLGEALKQTRAKVDKVNKEITLLVSETSANTEQISGLTTRASGIEANVSEMKTAQETTSSTLEAINNDITTLTNTVNAKVSAEDVKIEIQKEMSNGATSVKTTTGFTFDDNGLTIAKDGSEMTTNVDEDGISVYRDSEEVLTANNEGVVAYDLHAKTYLIVGTNSRFEDYEKDGEPRTGCFWIGETEVE